MNLQLIIKKLAKLDNLNMNGSSSIVLYGDESGEIRKINMKSIPFNNISTLQRKLNKLIKDKVALMGNKL